MEWLVRLLSIDVESIEFVVALAGSLVASGTDLAKKRIPNLLIGSLIGSGLIFHGLTGSGSGLAFSFVGFAVGLIALLPLFAKGSVAAGDVKLLAGVGVWMGPQDMLAIFVVFGCLFAMYAMVLNRVHRNRRDAGVADDGRDRRVEDFVAMRSQERSRKIIPMAPFVAAAIGCLGVSSILLGVIQNE